MTKIERTAVEDLVAAVDEIRPWLDDTAYPGRSRAELERSLEITRALLADDPAERRRKGKAR